MLSMDSGVFEVGDDVRYAVDLLKKHYRAKEGPKSNHTDEPRVAFDLPGGAQVMVPFNKTGLVMVLRDRTVDGRSLRSLIPASLVKYVYPDDRNAGTFLTSGKVPSLNPSMENKVLRLNLDRDDLRSVLDLYLNLGALVERPGEPIPPIPSPSPQSAVTERAGRTLEALLAQIDRNNETGRRGEAVALEIEVKRLRDAKCPDPERHVHHVALSDTGLGYDIHTTWPGHERYIEVKSTTRAGSDIFLTENEVSVLEELGPMAWLYRILVTPDGGQMLGEPLSDPIPSLRRAGMRTAVWRASDPTT